MNSEEYRVRRATVEDLGKLRMLWESMRLAPDDLEKRLTDFQIVEGRDGRLLGAVGFQINGRTGRLHSEGFVDFAVADDTRPLLWKRIQSLAMNHGVFRVWTQEQAPFWGQNGFQPASAEALQKLPEVWSGLGNGWRTLQLKDEEVLASAEKELAMFIEAEKQRTAKTLGQARLLKQLATVVTCIVAVALIAAAVYMFLRRAPGLP
jgi:N-acetylglutamate synthase-like GNAT family acetyltransferase